MPVPSVSGLAPIVAVGAAAGTAAASTLGGFASLMARALKGPGANAQGGSLSASFGAGVPIGEDAATGGPQSRLSELLEKLRLSVEQHLAAFGVASPSELRLQLDGSDRVRVVGDGSARPHLEPLLQTIPGLADLLKGVQAVAQSGARKTVVIGGGRAWVED